MRITESKLRRIIRSVIKESFPMRRTPQGKAARKAKYFEDIDDIMNLLQLKDINFSYKKYGDQAPEHYHDGASSYEYKLSANVRNPYTKSFEEISVVADNDEDSFEPFSIENLEFNNYKNTRAGIKDFFIDTFMYEFFEKMYKIFNPGKMSRGKSGKAYHRHKDSGIISDLYDEIARQILSNASLKNHNDFEGFLYDILKKSADGTL